MPTGYTSEIGTKDNLTFKEFTLKCARAFGACIHQRDDASDILPQKQKVDNYHISQLNAAIKKLKTFKKTSKKVLRQKMERDFLKRNKELLISIEKTHALQNKYKLMLKKVNNWIPPSTEHDGLKKFMIEQIAESIKWDCSTSYQEEGLSREKESFEEHYVAELKSLEDDIKYHEKKYNEDVERTNKANRWIEELYNSLN
jgi:hypothetical protein